MGQLTKAAAQLDKFMKTDTLTEKYHSMKCLHACIAICANVIHCAETCRIVGEDV